MWLIHIEKSSVPLNVLLMSVCLEDLQIGVLKIFPNFCCCCRPQEQFPFFFLLKGSDLQASKVWCLISVRYNTYFKRKKLSLLHYQNKEHESSCLKTIILILAVLLVSRESTLWNSRDLRWIGIFQVLKSIFYWWFDFRHIRHHHVLSVLAKTNNKNRLII